MSATRRSFTSGENWTVTHFFREAIAEYADVHSEWDMAVERRFRCAVWVLWLCWVGGIAVSGERGKRELRFPRGSSFVVSSAGGWGCWPGSVWVRWTITPDGLCSSCEEPAESWWKAAVALSSLLPKGPTDGFAHVLEFDLGFPFPEKFSIGRAEPKRKTWENQYENIIGKGGNKAEDKHWKKFRRERQLKQSQRENLLLRTEDVMMRMGFNGSSCVSRFQCELRNFSSKNSLLEELLLALFSTSDEDGQLCDRFHHSCPVSLLHLLVHSEQISPNSL